MRDSLKISLRILLRVGTWFLAAISAATFAIASFMDEKNPKVQAVYRLSALAGLFAFFAETYIASRDQKDSEIAQIRLENNIAELKGNLRESKEKIVELAPRSLTLHQRQIILSACSAFPGQKALTQCMTSDAEGHQYAQQFRSIFREANWDAKILRQSNEFIDAGRVTVAIARSDSDQKIIIPAALALSRSLADIGLSSIPDIVAIDDSLAAGEMSLIIGVKTSPDVIATLVTRIEMVT